VTSENFPVRAGAAAPGEREIVLLAFDREVTAAEALAEAARLGLERPSYEDESVEYSTTYESQPAVGAGDRIVAAASLGAR
jgi:hypothetical protein